MSRRSPARAGPVGGGSGNSERISDTRVHIWLYRLLARFVDLVPVVVLFLGLYGTGGDVLMTNPDACDPAPAPNCNVASQSDRVGDDGQVIVEFTLLDGRVIDADHRTYQLFDTVYIADPPEASSYLVTLLYALGALVVVQGVWGWTPGKLLVGLRLADGARRSAGLSRALLRWALPDGLLGVIGIIAAVVEAPWPLRLLAAFAVLGLFRGLGELLPRLLGPISDQALGMGIVAKADFIGGQPERDQPGQPDVLEPQHEAQPDVQAQPEPVGAALPIRTAPLARAVEQPVLPDGDEASESPATVATLVEAPAEIPTFPPPPRRYPPPPQEPSAASSGPEPTERAEPVHTAGSTDNDLSANDTSDTFDPGDAPASAVVETPAITPSFEADRDHARALAEALAKDNALRLGIESPRPQVGGAASFPTVATDTAEAAAVPEPAEPAQAEEAEPATRAEPDPDPQIERGAADNADPYTPQWDPARRAYICWEPTSAQWVEWDEQNHAWGPISQ